MIILYRIIRWVSDLKVAIGLLFTIAIASSIGTTIPQGELKEAYLETYLDNPWMGFINGETILRLQLDHIYSSNWFLFLLLWLGIALIICSFRRQIPTLKSALKWVDYKDPKQLNKLVISEKIPTNNVKISITKLVNHLKNKGWSIKENEGRFAARRGVIGRGGPVLVHIGIILLMIGAAWGSLSGQKIEQFLINGNSFDLINLSGEKQLTLRLKDFQIQRDPVGRPEQFSSKLEILEPEQKDINIEQISVNHPIRYKGITIYQADWSLSSITLQIGDNPPLELPLSNFPELGDEIWGIVIPTKADGSEPILLSVSNEKGPIRIFDSNGNLLNTLGVGNDIQNVNGIPLKVKSISTASGLLIKRDPGVPLVYSGFAVTLIGGFLSILSTQQLWVITNKEKNFITIGGLCNRDLLGLSNQLPELVSLIKSSD